MTLPSIFYKVVSKNSNEDTENINFSANIKRYTANKFDGNILKNTFFDRFNISYLNDYDNDAYIRGRWNSRLEFILSCIGYTLGISHVWRFPIIVIQNGGAIFLIPYVILTLLVGIPLIILEMGIGQFTSKGCTMAFKCAPILQGIGWAQFVASSYILIFDSVFAAKAYLFIIGSLSLVLPWVSCNNTYNSPNCITSLESIKIQNKTINSSTEQYYYRFVLGFQKNDGKFYTMNENPGLPQLHLSLCLLVVFVILFLTNRYGVRVSGKIAYFTVILLPFILLPICLFTFTLPGATQGLALYLKPNISKLVEPWVYFTAAEYLISSFSLPIGGMITMASFNKFHDNFIRDAFIIVIINFFMTLLPVFIVFSILGYISNQKDENVETMIKDTAHLLFVTIIEALSTQSIPNFWIILLMITVISLALSTQTILLETIIIGILDNFSEIPRTAKQRRLYVLIICLTFFVISLVLVMPAGCYYLHILRDRFSNFGILIIALLECIAVGIVYGYENFHHDINMLAGFPVFTYPFYTMRYVCPVVISILLVSNLFNLKSLIVHGNSIPLWGELISLFCLLFLLFPIVINIVVKIITFRRFNSGCKKEEIIVSLILPKIEYGPHYKTNWLLDKRYARKFLKYYKNPDFINYLNKIESVKKIYLAARSMRIKKEESSILTNSSAQSKISSVTSKKSTYRIKYREENYFEQSELFEKMMD